MNKDDLIISYKIVKNKGYIMIYKTTWNYHCPEFHKIKHYLDNKYIKKYYINTSYPISVNVRLSGPYMYDKFIEEISSKLCIFIFKIKK